MVNKLLKVGMYKGRIVWASNKTYNKGYGPLYIQKKNRLQRLTSNQEKQIIEYK